MSIAWAVAEYLHDLEGQVGVRNPLRHPLPRAGTELAESQNAGARTTTWRSRNGGEACDLPAQAGPGRHQPFSYGLAVARLAGLPSAVHGPGRRGSGRTGERRTRPVRHGARLAAKPRKERKPPPAQLSLVRARSEDPVLTRLEELRNMDLDSMTPLEALQANWLKSRVNWKAS